MKQDQQMEDSQIVDLYWARNEDAILRTQSKYGKYLYKIADNILCCSEDSEESVNDTYLRAWNSMPDNRPQVLSTYLGKITRRLAIDIYRKKSTQKRGGSQWDLVLDELEECLAGGSEPEQQLEQTMLTEAINRFLKDRPEKQRNIFIRRYFYCAEISEIARDAEMKEVSVRSVLCREREELRRFLEREGYSV